MTELQDYLMNPGDPVDAGIRDVERALAPLRAIDVTSRVEASHRSAAVVGSIRVASRRSMWSRVIAGPLVAAAVLTVLFGAVETYGRAMRPWTVVNIPSGVPLAAVPQPRAVVAGDWIVTDSASSARLNVGFIGRTRIEPGSRVKVVDASTGRYRLALERGQLHARIWAPPRFFTVETGKALAVDLGCEYTLRAYPDGSAWLRVESGEVELVGSGSVVRIPAGNSASIQADGSPGIPTPSTASDTMVRAVTMFEQTRDDRSLDALLSITDSSSTIVLFHLIPRVYASDRGEVFDKLESIHGVHRGVSREAILRLDASALETLRTSLAPSWTTEVVPLWKQWWRAGWSVLRGSPG